MQKGVNLIGSIRTETGIGESSRLAANALHSAKIPFGILNFQMNKSTKNKDFTWVKKEIAIPHFNVNLFHVNASHMTSALEHFGSELFKNRFNIGYWAWELPKFPNIWNESFKLVDEVWVPSAFIQDAIRENSSVPVIKIPHSIEVLIRKRLNRTYFSLPSNRYLFLTMYDSLSIQTRKNPCAVIKAFKLAFPPNDGNVGLVVKVNNSRRNWEEIERLKGECSGYRNIFVINEVYQRNELNNLLNVIDCFVSLHRAEGFGLGIAEAMYLGKPVIATNWSGNLEFMTNKNSMLVNYLLVPIDKNAGPYTTDQLWAEADIEHAAFCMKEIFLNRQLAAMLAVEGQKVIRTHFSANETGKLISNRLNFLKLLDD